MPECSIPLLIRDLLSKLEAQIIFKNGEIQLLVPQTKAIREKTFMLQGRPEPDNSGRLPEAIENAVTSLIWASRSPGHSR